LIFSVTLIGCIPLSYPMSTFSSSQNAIQRSALQADSTGIS
jgi:hypothetical protein